MTMEIIHDKNSSENLKINTKKLNPKDMMKAYMDTWP